jgi:hypothetical protein
LISSLATWLLTSFYLPFFVRLSSVTFFLVYLSILITFLFLFYSLFHFLILFLSFRPLCTIHISCFHILRIPSVFLPLPFVNISTVI